MPGRSLRALFKLSESDVAELSAISTSRTLPAGRVTRAKLLLMYHAGLPINEISIRCEVSASTIHNGVSRALESGPFNALDELPRSGRPNEITKEAINWMVSVVCQQPKDLGYPEELWTLNLLSKHLQANCISNGHPCLSKIVKSTVQKLLKKQELKPHKVRYYLERRDPDFDEKMVEVLCVYKQVELYKTTGMPEEYSAVLSYDEKPGIQAISNIAPDLPPVPGKHPELGRDYEYKRLGTVSLLSAIDLVTGNVYGIVRDRHRTAEFIEFLEMVNGIYRPNTIIQIVLDNHSTHTSKELMKYLETKPGRFEFVFTPKHGSWLNLIEVFFSKMTRSMLRGIRVASKQELIDRIELYLKSINADPIIFKWKYKLDQAIII